MDWSLLHDDAALGDFTSIQVRTITGKQRVSQPVHSWPPAGATAGDCFY